MKTFIVTGCAGFIGLAFTKHLFASNQHTYPLYPQNIVYGIDKFTYASRHNKESIEILKQVDREGFQKFTFLEKDISDIDYLPNADYIINFAAETHVDNSINNQSSFVRSNILGVERLLQLVRQKPKHDRPLFVHISTDEVYGDNPPENGFTEESPINPSSPYSASKASADALVMGYCKTFGIDYMIIRPTNNYGFGQYPEKLIPKNIQLLDRGKKMIMYGDGKNKRYWLHVSDTVKAILCAIENGKPNNIYNVSGDVVLENREVLRLIYKGYNRIADFENLSYNYLLGDYCISVPNRLAEDKLYKVNDSKIRSLGWKPLKNDFETVLRDEILYDHGIRRTQVDVF